MRALHIVKTVEGAGWAALQAEQLSAQGVELHVALPAQSGRRVEQWKRFAAIHVVDLDFPARSPWRLPQVSAAARKLVDEVRPDLIHSHFAGTTLLLRRALGADHPTPRIFQVPGPLHLEHCFFRQWDLRSAGPSDYWIGSSRCIVDHYRAAGIPPERMFLSYYGMALPAAEPRRVGELRDRLGIPRDHLVVGNMNFMYPPKRYLGQHIGLKAHEDVIDALAIVTRERHDVTGLVIGSQWGGGHSYEERLQRRANQAGGRIILPGYLPEEDRWRIWAEFDCALHVPISENCGGAVEPLFCGVPVVAARTGGLPELVMEGVTGTLVPPRDPVQAADAVLRVLADLDRYRSLAAAGSYLVRAAFAVTRTASEIAGIYRHILGGGHPRPKEFSTRDYARRLRQEPPHPRAAAATTGSI